MIKKEKRIDMLLYDKIFPHTAHKPTHPRWRAHYRPKSGSHQSLTWWTMSPIGATHGHMGEGLLIEVEMTQRQLHYQSLLLQHG